MDYLVPIIICGGFFYPPTKFGQLVPYNNTILIMYFPNITTLWFIYSHLLPNLCHLADENVCPNHVWQNHLGGDLLMFFWKKDKKWFGSEFWVEYFLVRISQGSACTFSWGKASQHPQHEVSVV